MGIIQERKEQIRKEGKKKEELDYNRALFAILRQKRKSMADEAGRPPYVIFSDRTLIEMSAYYPHSTESLLNIAGVGQVKAGQYGDTFLGMIKSFCEKHGLQERPHHSQKERGESAPISTVGKSRRDGKEIGEHTRLVGQAYNTGKSIESLMERYKVMMATILDHLTRFVAAGNFLRNGEDLQSLTSATPEQQHAAFAAFDELVQLFLSPFTISWTEA